MKNGEKRTILSMYCESTSCRDCKLAVGDWYHQIESNETKGCLAICDASEPELNRALELIGYGEIKPKSDNVNHPNHYQGKNECIDVMVALFGVEAVKSFCRCNAYKYRFRSQAKNGDEDIKKAEWYETKLIELESEDK